MARGSLRKGAFTARLVVLLCSSVGGALADDVDQPFQLSGGCGKPAPDVPPSSVAVGDRTRAVITVVPGGYRPDTVHALVVAFHGRTNSNAQVQRYFDLERHASGPMIFVYPAGLADVFGRYTWSEPGEPTTGLRDFALFDSVLERMAGTYCIDRNRVFVVGHSLGAWFANSLACARGGVIRGLGSIGGGITRPKDCTGPVAAMVLHNPHDAQVPIQQGIQVRNALLQQNRLLPDGRPEHMERFDCSRYGSDAAENPVLWCPHVDNVTASGRFYPHQWPVGSGTAFMEFFAGLQ